MQLSDFIVESLETDVGRLWQAEHRVFSSSCFHVFNLKIEDSATRTHFLSA